MDHSPSLSRILHYMKPVKWRFLLSLAFLLLIACLTAAKAWIIQPVVDTFLGGRANHRDLVILSLIVATIFVSQAVLLWLYNVVARTASARVIVDIRASLFNHLTTQSLSFFTDRASADLTSRVVNDVSAFETAAVGSLQNLFRDLLTVILLLLLLFSKDWRLALACLAVGIVAGWILKVMGTKIQRVSRQVQSMVSQIHQQLSEVIGGFELILAFSQEGAWKERFDTALEKHYTTQIRATKINKAAVLLVLLVVGISLSLILYIMGRALIEGRISPGDFGSFLAAMYLLQSPAMTIGNSLASLSRGTAAAGRALELLEISPTVKEPATPSSPPSGPIGVEFQDVGFGYRDGAPAIDGLSFDLRPNELVVMVGDSGAGKSTVARLLLRFYDPDSGQILVGGVPIHQLSRKDLYDLVTYVSQDVFLYDETLEFNLKIGNPSATDEEVDAALRVAGVDRFLSTLPNGLQTRVGERGARLSGGQRQRISLARAILRPAPVLVLDEATSALDLELEQQVIGNLAHSSESRTVFAITHRLSLAEIADRVLVLKDGGLAQEGRPDDLAAHPGEFSRLLSFARGWSKGRSENR